MNCGYSEAYLTNRTISVVENFDHTHSTSSSQDTECGYRNNTRTVLDKRKCLHLTKSVYVYKSLLCLLVDQVVSDDRFQLLSVEIASKWRNVAHCLKPEPMHGRILEDIAIQHQGNLQEQALHMLEMWKEKHGRKACIKTLCEVLINADHRSSAEKVFGREAVQQILSHMKETNSEGWTVQWWFLTNS